jgi:2-polyprenyl-3-methyl-5-hydroxy-6-metoxy-1,4-benzoquinol methylase
MPTVEQNLQFWGRDHRWDNDGDKWSSWWGGTPAMWFAAVLPRVQGFVPTGTMLEIAPGFGRWTQYFKDLADRLIVVDISERCIERCQSRFADASNITYHVNDGRSLEMVDDGSVDFAISLDSLVHVEPSVLESYLTQLSAKLSEDGVGLFHHSNLGRYAKRVGITKRTPERLRQTLVKRGTLIDLSAWRDETMTVEGFEQLCAEAGLSCIGQEEVSWASEAHLTDAFSLFTRRGSRWDRANRRFRSPWLRDDALLMRRLWSASSFTR